jgi:hypothetical protein
MHPWLAAVVEQTYKTVKVSYLRVICGPLYRVSSIQQAYFLTHTEAWDLSRKDGILTGVIFNALKQLPAE